jgi:hypothetical protein
MADFTALNQAVSDLMTEVAADVANMDKLFTDLQAALAAPAADQATIDAATAAVQAQIQALKDDVAAHTAP